MQGIVKQIDLYGELKGDCFFAKSLEFNSSGDLLVSATTDKQVIFWKWETITRRLSYDAGHSEHLLHVKIMPLTNDRRVVTAGRGGQVRLGQVLDDGQVHTKKLGSHRDIYNKIICSLAVEPGNPNIIYSSGFRFSCSARTYVYFLLSLYISYVIYPSSGADHILTLICMHAV